MTLASTRHSHVHVIPRPQLHRAGWIAITLLGVLAIGAIGGAIGLLLAPDGSRMGWSVTMLAGSPFADFLVPGLLLGIVFGVGPLATIVLGLRHARVAPFLAFAIGVGQMIWIVVELAIIGQLSFLHPAMFLTGLGIALAAVTWGWPTFTAWRHSSIRAGSSFV